MDQSLFNNIETIFIDLDDTIWDFTANSKIAMRIVYNKYGLQEQCPYEHFEKVYFSINSELWEQYHHAQITKEYLKRERFSRSFRECGIVYEEPEKFDFEYLETIVQQSNIVPGALELLQHLTLKFKVHVLSNGFSNLQYRKLQSGGLDKYITEIVLSDDINITKPDKRLFDYALSRVNGIAESTLMIGDNYDADILGAINAGWRTIYFNRKGINPGPNLADLTVVNLEDIIPFF